MSSVDDTFKNGSAFYTASLALPGATPEDVCASWAATFKPTYGHEACTLQLKAVVNVAGFVATNECSATIMVTVLRRVLPYTPIPASDSYITVDQP
jgi:hypothetical protein